jgi:signal-transduction protein with cAMP-binding, CBS, and nucleotidyltransferase domain
MNPLDSTVAQLRDFSPFEQAPARVLEQLGPHVDRLRLRAGTVLAREGHVARELVIVLDGDVLATRHGDEVLRGSTGTQIGADNVLDRRPHDRTWIAGTDLDVVVVNGPAYRWAAPSLRVAA